MNKEELLKILHKKAEYYENKKDTWIFENQSYIDYGKMLAYIEIIHIIEVNGKGY